MDVRVYANSDDTLIAWKIDAPIPRCRGFAIYRRTQGASKADVLTNRVGWEADAKGKQREAPSTRWPIQRFIWTDYKARSGDRLEYRVVPMAGDDPDHLAPAEDLASAWTDAVTLQPDGAHGVSAYFNRGIVASQWLSRVLGPGPPGERQKRLAAIVEDPDDRTRKFLGGELRAAMLRLLAKARAERQQVYAALYELDDPELAEALGKLGPRAHVILANGSTKEKKKDPNRRVRKALREAGVEVHDRMTAPRHLAHNKFVVFAPNDEPESVWTGSTNWSKTGLCTQANNGVVFTHATLAAAYKAQWDQLLDAKSTFDRAALAEANSTGSALEEGGGRSVKVWFTPVNDEADLEEARELIAKARRGILFIMFNPGPAGTLLNAIIDRKGEPDLIVQGVVNQDPSTAKNPVLIFRRKEVLRGTFQVALPAAIDRRVTFWIPELKKKQGAWAMVHSKVIAIDPFGPRPVVITGSHNLGPKASRSNDDNLVIIRGDRELAAAYAVNIAGIYTSYRWRYNRLYSEQARSFTHLEDSDTWQQGHLEGERLQELNFWMGQG